MTGAGDQRVEDGLAKERISRLSKALTRINASLDLDIRSGTRSWKAPALTGARYGAITEVRPPSATGTPPSLSAGRGCRA